jgi:hypothetical protein
MLRRTLPHFRVVQSAYVRRTVPTLQKRMYASEGEEEHGHRIQPDEKVKPFIAYGFAAGLVLLGWYLGRGGKKEQVEEKAEEKQAQVQEKHAQH